MIDHIDDYGRYRRGWTAGRLAGWLLVVLGVALEWRTWSAEHITYGMELGSGIWLVGSITLLGSWALWRRRRAFAEKSQIFLKSGSYPTTPEV